ncbi:MAG: acyl-CoA thioesterase [Deltaproteobacteria bacterium]
MKQRIFYHHTDSGGVVYYATYLAFLEEARTLWMEERGVSVKDMMAQGTFFVVARQEMDYMAPAFYGDTVEVTTALGEVSRVRVELSHELFNQDKKLLGRAKTTFALISSDFKLKSIPPEMKERLTRA